MVWSRQLNVQHWATRKVHSSRSTLLFWRSITQTKKIATRLRHEYRGRLYTHVYHTHTTMYLLCGVASFMSQREDQSSSQYLALSDARRVLNMRLPGMSNEPMINRFGVRRNAREVAYSWYRPCETQPAGPAKPRPIAPSWHCWDSHSQ